VLCSRDVSPAESPVYLAMQEHQLIERHRFQRGDDGWHALEPAASAHTCWASSASLLRSNPALHAAASGVKERWRRCWRNRWIRSVYKLICSDLGIAGQVHLSKHRRGGKECGASVPESQPEAAATDESTLRRITRSEILLYLK